MPQMGVSVAEGTVVEWKKQVGDWVQADEIIASISTDKIDTDVESPASGRVAEIVVQVGETVDVGTVMARIATDARPGEAPVAETGTGEATAAPQPAGGGRGGPRRARAGGGRRGGRRAGRASWGATPRPPTSPARGGGPPAGAAPAATRRWSCGSPQSTGSTSSRWRAPAGAG